MGQGTTLLLLLISINACLYIAGFNAPFLNMMTGDWSSATTLIASLIVAVGGIAVASALLGQGAVYTIPLAMVTIIANVFLFPMSSINMVGLPPVISGIISLFLNVLLLGIIISFIRGSDF